MSRYALLRPSGAPMCTVWPASRIIYVLSVLRREMSKS